MWPTHTALASASTSQSSITCAARRSRGARSCRDGGDRGAAPAQRKLRFLQLDLASLHATMAAAEEFAQREERLDVLSASPSSYSKRILFSDCVLNVGRLYDDFVVTMDGLEQTVDSEVKCQALLATRFLEAVNKTVNICIELNTI
jgi:hypothetical protein